ncbi:hypothetical protein HHI36_018481 [Cryptolaemus montrouzieri]|uniref:Uncharacterized protein n=1 Tax=Cryptolaemus montrouzieri TaxID=559131 RepID=A0ABD2P020_9CUCU
MSSDNFDKKQYVDLVPVRFEDNFFDRQEPPTYVDELQGFIQNFILTEIIEAVIDRIESRKITKQKVLRKRKKFDENPWEEKDKKLQKLQENTASN